MLGFALAGCRDDASATDEPGGSEGGSDESGAMDDGGSDDGGSDNGPRAGCEAPGGVHTPMRRLTRVEYDNTVRDLVGDTTHPAAAFQMDDAAAGFAANGSSPVTQPQVEKYIAAAEALAEATDLDLLVTCDPSDDDLGCARTFIESFGLRAYRRPLSTDEVDALEALYTGKRATADFDTAARLVVTAMLQSPTFLYRPEFGDPDLDAPEGLAALDGYEVASRLSYMVWASTPDDALLAAAAAGTLGTAAGLEAEARRMLDDGRAADAAVSFHEQWLGLESFDLIEKPDNADFSPELRASMRTSAAMLFEAIMMGDDPTLSALLSADYAFADAAMAPVLGVQVSGEGFERVDLPSERAIGILGVPALLAATSHDTYPSPVFRGVLVREQLLCDTPPPPPDDVDDTPPVLDPDATGREKYEQLFAPAACAACHGLINPVGYGLEHFDAIGRWRETDAGLPVDATGELLATLDIDGEFDGASELAQRLAGSEQVRACLQKKWFRFALGRWEDPVLDACSLESIARSFQGSDYDLRELIVAVVISDAFRFTTAAAQ